MKRLEIGSVTFGTANIRTDEYVLLAQVIVENGRTVKQAAIEIQAIDDLLGLQKVQSLLNGQRLTKTGRIRKNSSFIETVERRIDILIDELKTEAA